MTASNTGRRRWRGGLFALGLLGILGLTGCQIDVGGQTLPSPWYLNDDVQYFPPGANSRFRMKRTRRRPSRWSRRSSDKRPRKRIVPVTRGVAGTLVSTFTAACRAELPAAQLGSGDGPLCGVKPSRRGDGKLARLASMIEAFGAHRSGRRSAGCFFQQDRLTRSLVKVRGCRRLRVKRVLCPNFHPSHRPGYRSFWSGLDSAALRGCWRGYFCRFASHPVPWHC